MKKAIIFSFFLCFCLCQSFAQGPFTWSELPEMPKKVANNAVCEGFVNGEPFVYSFSGIDSTKGHDGIHLKSYRLDVNAGIWESIADLPDTSGKIATSANRVGDTIYIIGGYHVLANGNEVSSNKVHRYIPSSNTFISDGANIPKAIDDQVQAVWRDSLIFVVTGWSNTGNVSDVQIYNPRQNVWQTGTPVPVTQNLYRVFGGAGIIIGDTIYYYGGAKSSNNFPVTDVLRKGVINPNDPTDITWSVVTAGPQRQYRPAALNYDDKAYWIGGSTISYNYDGLAYFNGAGVEPTDLFWSLNATNEEIRSYSAPYQVMDLRGVAQIATDKWVIAGGMEPGQVVSRKSYLLEVNPIFVGLKESQELGALIYPNPVLDGFVQLPFALDMTWELYNGVGQLQKQGKSHDIYVSDLKSGIYFFRLHFDGQYVYRKVEINN